MTTTETETDPRKTFRLGLGLVWLVAPGWCLVKALELLFHLFGESATPAEEAEASRWLTAAVLVSLGVSLAGLLFGGRRLWWAALALSVVFSAVAAASVVELRPDGPPAPRTTVCQERSGGDSDCPGG